MQLGGYACGQHRAPTTLRDTAWTCHVGCSAAGIVPQSLTDSAASAALSTGAVVARSTSAHQSLKACLASFKSHPSACPRFYCCHDSSSPFLPSQHTTLAKIQHTNMARPFKSPIPIILLLLATILVTTAAFNTQVSVGSRADTLRSLQQVPKPDQNTGVGRHRMLPSVFSTKVTPAVVGVVNTPSTDKGRRLQGKQGPGFARKMPYVFPHKSAPDAVVVDTLSLLLKGRKLSDAFDADFVDDIGLASRDLMAHKGPEFSRQLPSVYSARVTPTAVGVVDALSTAKEGRRLQGKQGPDIARKMPYVFPHKSAPDAVVVDTFSLSLKGRKLLHSLDADFGDGVGLASRDLTAHKGPDFARRLPTTFSGKSNAQPVAISDASVAASNSVVLGSYPEGRKLAALSGTGSGVLGHGRLLPTIRNSGTNVDGAPEGVYASSFTSAQISARSGR